MSDSVTTSTRRAAPALEGRTIGVLEARMTDTIATLFEREGALVVRAPALAEAIVDAARLGLDPGSEAVLERYQRWRRFDTMAMGAATDGLNRLFSNQSGVLRLVRDVGLGLVDRLPALKQLFIREAAGLVGEVPKLLKGEAL